MKLVIIGSGMAGITLAEEVRKLNPDTEITVITTETKAYYSRPMLSHGFSREDIETKIILKSFEALQDLGIHVLEGIKAKSIDRSSHKVHCERDDIHFDVSYDKLVLATGSDALIPGVFKTERNLFFVVNSLEDLLALRQLRNSVLLTDQIPRWAVIGGGLIGCEVASDLAKAGDQVELFHALPKLMEQQLTEEDSVSLKKVLENLGIELRLDTLVKGIETSEDSLNTIITEQGVEPGFHGVIIACGFAPRTQIALESGLAVNRGILVDDHLKTNDPDIHAIGDVAEWVDGKIYAYIVPVRQQATWLGQYLEGKTHTAWTLPDFKPRAKVHGFTAQNPYLL